MKKVIVWPENCVQGFEEVLKTEEPIYLHITGYIVFALMVTVFLFVCFGKVDEKVRSSGLVRTEKNISCVKVYSGGEISSINYVPGQLVNAGEVLLRIDSGALEVEKNAYVIKEKDCLEKLDGLTKMIQGYEEKKQDINCVSKTCKSRYAAFIAEKELIEVKIKRLKTLYEDEKQLPPSATTDFDIKNKRFDYEYAVLEKNEYEKSFICAIRGELDSLKIEYAGIKQTLEQLEIGLKNLELQSPVSGCVQEICLLNPGDFVFADQEILNIVPLDSGCRVELNISAEKMGKIKEGQKVLLRFPAFPFSEFKGLEGRISMIQPDSRVFDDGRVYFKAYVELDSTLLRSRKKEEYQIKSGFEVDARIILERQTLLTFLLRKLDLDL